MLPCCAQSVGLGGKIPEAPKGFRLKRATVESLAGKWKEDTEWSPPQKDGRAAPAVQHSPHSGAAIAQDLLEPTLRERAREFGTDLRLGSKLIQFTQDEGGVTTTIEEKSGRTYELRAAYMIAADGGKSAVRETLGIGRQGPGHLQTVRSVLFPAPELDAYLEKEIHQFEMDQPDLRAFLTTYGNGRWVLMFLDEKERMEAEQREATVRATGRPDINFEIVTTGCWELGALIADRFQEGRVFIAGDAAHALPPTRGVLRREHRYRRRAQPRMEARGCATRKVVIGAARYVRGRATPGGVDAHGADLRAAGLPPPASLRRRRDGVRAASAENWPVLA